MIRFRSLRLKVAPIPVSTRVLVEARALWRQRQHVKWALASPATSS
jgi:hypothetical protein